MSFRRIDPAPRYREIAWVFIATALGFWAVLGVFGIALAVALASRSLDRVLQSGGPESIDLAEVRYVWMSRDLVVWGSGRGRRDSLYRGEVDAATYAAVRRRLKAQAARL